MYTYTYTHTHTYTYTHRREVMYINAFVDGILATVTFEMVVVFTLALVAAFKKVKRK